MRVRTISDTPMERQIYERAAREQEAYLVEELLEIVATMPTPKGWYKRGRVGRPRKKSRGAKETYHWSGLVVALTLKTYYHLDFRGIASHLAANPKLCQRLGFPDAPSAATINRAQNRLAESWLKALNKQIVAPPKKTDPDDPEASRPVWIQLDLPS